MCVTAGYTIPSSFLSTVVNQPYLYLTKSKGLRSIRLQRYLRSNTGGFPGSRDHVQRPTPDYLFRDTGASGPVTLDYDRLVSNVENQIMADQAPGAGSRYDPVYLLYKSNPGLLDSYTDFTTPQNVYSLISKRRVRSYDDVSQVSKSAETVPSDVRRITRTTSMRELRRAAGLRTAPRKDRYHSSQDLSSLTLKERKDPSITALFVNAPYLNLKDLEHLPEVDAQRVTRTVLPTIPSKKRVKTRAPPFRLTEDDKSFSLPRINSDFGDTFAYGTNGEERSDVIKKRMIRLEGVPSVAEENKLEKWFSDMPDDVIDRAERRASAESESDSVQKRVPRKSSLERVHLPVLRPLNPIPNQYLELRENVKRPMKPDVTIDREKYKLKQRSMLQLKVLHADENTRAERTRTHIDADVPVYQYDADKFHPPEQKSTLKDLIHAKKQDGNGLKTVNIDQFAVEAYDIHPSEKFNFAKQMEENLAGAPGLYRTRTSVELTPIRPRNTLPQTSESRVRPCHRDAERPLDRALTVMKIEKPGEDPKQEQAESERQGTCSDSHISVTTKNGCNARPPTRDSIQEPNKSEAKREILKFKRLEVFGDHASTKPNTAKMADKPLVKLDLRPSPSDWQNSPDVAPHPPLPLIQRDLKKELPAMTFQFSTGEVIISRNAANAPSPPRDHQRHSFYPKRGPIKSSSVIEAAPPRSDSCASQTEPTPKHSERSGTDANSTDYTMTPDYRNISEFNLTGRGRPRGRLWDFDGDVPHPESLLGSRKNTIEEIPEETMDQLSPDPPVTEPPKQPAVVDNPPPEMPVHSSNTTPLDQLPSPSELITPTEKMDVDTELAKVNQSTPEEPVADPTTVGAEPSPNQEVEPPRNTIEDNKEKKEEVKEGNGIQLEFTANKEKTMRDAATSATSLVEASKRQNASSKNTNHSPDSIAEVFGK